LYKPNNNLWQLSAVIALYNRYISNVIEV